MLDTVRDGNPRHFVFVLLPNFSLLSLAGALDALRLSNHIAGHPLYSWTLTADGGGTATGAAGATFVLDGDLPQTHRDDTIVLVSGVDVKNAASKRLIAWLRREARNAVPIAGLCTAAHVLGQAGLLDGKRATIHWENYNGILEAFPDIELTRSVYTIDGKIMTSAGGTAAIDLMLHIVAQHQGDAFAGIVADQMIYSSIRTDRDSQRLSIPARIGVRHPRLSAVIEAMEETIEEPVSPSLLAADVGMSTRQLERLFRRYLNRSPKRYYMELRLTRARNLLMQTDMSIIDIALACGFTSPSHFSKCYRAMYQTTPYRERGAQGSTKAS
ncbi:GlxA family transcriptional regulator [Jannaschia sp. LMIT008]|uniref:GlxA family transcriptional regulator n=1 Tax=Jannaschia maritima TaxID=3032585 RepID=UPI002810D941|nr:GlxA family transcriptional regulator [Jannaschia sp. LMIT008]